MVYAGEGHIDELQVGAVGNDLPTEGHVGQHNDVGVSRPLELDLGIGILGIGLKGVASLHKGPGALVQKGVRHAQGLQKYDFHL